MHLLIADDHTLFRDALVELIRRADGSVRVDVAKSFHEAMDVMARLGGGVDLVLLDLRMPGMSGAEDDTGQGAGLGAGASAGVGIMRARYPEQKIAIISGTAEEADVTQALKAGAVGYFPKTMSATSLLRAIQMVVAGERFVPLGQTGSAVMPSHYEDDTPRGAQRADCGTVTSLPGGLTPREREVLGFLGRGASNKDIARELHLQPATIKLHVAGVCRKLKVKNRTQAALIAQNAGIS